MTHHQLKEVALNDPKTKAAYEALQAEFAQLKKQLRTRSYTIPMTSIPQQPPFLRGDIEGVLPIVSVWLRNLQEVEEIVDKWGADLNPEGFWWVPSEAANPIGGLIRHIGGASYRLWLRGSGQEIPNHIKIKPADEMALRGEVAEVLAEFGERMEMVKRGLSGLSEADLNRTAVFPAATAKAIYVFDHIAGHAQQHAGQIITTRKLWDRR